MKIHFTNIVVILVLLPVAVEAQRNVPPKQEVVLEGAVNFRDLGGYATTDYRHVRMWKVYRASDISKLTDADMEELKRRKIYIVIDFRSDEEATDAPDRLLPGTDYLRLSAGSGNTDDLAALAGSNISGTDAMIAFYSDVSAYKEKYRPFFRKLLTAPDSSAIMFHCTAGKDRTGIASALLLYAMDVPMETILTDYVATNFYRKAENEKMIEEMVGKGIDRQTATEIMDANPVYLESMFNSLKRHYGSIDSFMYKELGMGEQARFRLRERYLQ